MPTMIGPTLPDRYYQSVESIWDDLEAEFGVPRPGNPYPHFSFYLLEDASPPAIESAVADVATEHSPVTVHTDGIGVFPGDHVWLPVSRSPEMAALHRDVVDAVSGLGTAPTPYYEPHRWFPHVAFALGVNAELAGEIVTFLLDYDLDWEFTVDNVSLTRPPTPGDDHELVASIDL